jgi:hypothetical protein
MPCGKFHHRTNGENHRHLVDLENSHDVSGRVCAREQKID